MVERDAPQQAREQGAVVAFAAHDLRRRWRTVVITGLLAGIVAGIGIACLAGARRTDSLFDRYFAASRSSHVEIDPGDPNPATDQALRSLPEVESVAYWALVSAYVLDDQGQLDVRYAGAVNFSTDGRYLDQDLVTVGAGRRLDPTKRDEVMLNQYYADVLHARVGTQLDLGTVPTDPDGIPVQSEPTATVRATVVGIMVFPDDVIGSQLDQVPKMFVSPAFGHLIETRDPAYVGYAWYGLRLKGGDADVDSVMARWQGLASAHNEAHPDEPPWLSFVHRNSDVRRAASRSVRPMVTALGTFGGLVLLSSIILLAQALARSVRLARDDLRRGQILGLTSQQTARIAVAAPAAVAVIAAVTALVVSIIGSWQFPSGPSRVLEPDPGVDVDLLVIGLALAGLVVAPLAVAAAVARQQARQHVLGERQGARRPSRLTTALAAVGVPLPVLSAVRLTVEPGRDQSFVPTRLVLLTSVTTVILLVTTIVFGHNLGALADQPERYGWRSDGMVMIDGGYGGIEADTSSGWLDGRDELDGWRLVAADRTSVSGRETPGLVYGPSGGDGGNMLPVLVEGRAPERAGEAVLGRRTLDDLHVHVDDSITVGTGDVARSLRITGIAVFPEIGPVLAIRTRLDDGLWAHVDDSAVFESIGAYGHVFNALLVDIAAGRSQDDLVAAMYSSPLAEVGSSIDSFGVMQPIEVETAAAAGRAQAALVTAVAAAAVLSLVLTLVTVVRRRRYDLSILAALGFTPAQLRTTVLVQGLLFGLTGAIFGTPIGLVLGRQLWQMFADTLGVVPDPTVPWATIVLTVVAAIVVGFASALAPAVSAGRSSSTRFSPE